MVLCTLPPNATEDGRQPCPTCCLATCHPWLLNSEEYLQLSYGRMVPSQSCCLSPNIKIRSKLIHPSSFKVVPFSCLISVSPHDLYHTHCYMHFLTHTRILLSTIRYLASGSYEFLSSPPHVSLHYFKVLWGPLLTLFNSSMKLVNYPQYCATHQQIFLFVFSLGQTVPFPYLISSVFSITFLMYFYFTSAFFYQIFKVMKDSFSSSLPFLLFIINTKHLQLNASPFCVAYHFYDDCTYF